MSTSQTPAGHAPDVASPDAETVTVSRALFRRVLRDEGLTTTGSGRGDQVFDALAAAAKAAGESYLPGEPAPGRM